jgi:adenylate kinase
MKIILMFGPPGVGKGTQAARLSAWLQVPSLSTGEILRTEAASGSELGREIQSILASGKFVSDDLVNQIVSGQLDTPRFERGCILDGYPRTVEQAIFLDTELAYRSLPRPVVVDLQVPEAVIVRRLSLRRQCPTCKKVYHLEDQKPMSPGICDMCEVNLIHRSDDVPAVIRDRLAVYKAATTPVLSHYGSNSCVPIDGNRNPADVFQAIQTGIERALR